MDVLSWLPAQIDIRIALLLIGLSFLTSAISATFGMGGGVAMLIVLISLTPPVIALPVHALIQMGSNAGRAWMLRSHIMAGLFWWFLPGSLIGVLLASHLVVTLPISWLELVLALFVLWSIYMPGIASKPVSDRSYLGVGAVTSFATMFVGATGPLLAIFIAPDRYGRDRTVATHAACMMCQHLIKLIAFGFLGFVFADWIPLVGLMILSGLAGTHVGKDLLYRLPEKQFRIAFKTVLTLLAIRLMYRAVSVYF